MYFKRLDPDSTASRGDLEALLEAQRACHFWATEVVKDAADFVDNPFEHRHNKLATSCGFLIQARQACSTLEESISPTPRREGA